MRAPFREAAMGFAQVTVACEPTGHRWRVLGQLAADLQLLFVLSSQLACTTDLAWALRLVPLRSSPKRMTMRYSDDPHRSRRRIVVVKPLAECHNDDVVAADVALLKSTGHHDQAVGHGAVGGPRRHRRRSPSTRVRFLLSDRSVWPTLS